MIYITGDLHGDRGISKLNNDRFKEGKNLTRDDYLIIAGDFGLVWDKSERQAYWRKWLNNKPYTTLFVDGNHDNFDLLDAMPLIEWNGGKVHFVEENIIHLTRGQIFEIQGKKIFTFGGADSIDKYHRLEGISWWEREMPSKAEYDEGLDNLKKYNNKIDYIITHTCSGLVYPKLQKYFIGEPYTTVLNDYFDIIEQEIKFKHWYFGHFHGDENLDKKHTLMYNKILKII